MNVENKRSFPRLNTLLPFEVRRVSSDERKDLKCRISSGTIVIDDSTPPPLEDERLNMWLNMLNTKLDYLISLDTPKLEDIVAMAFRPLNISASGMSLMAKEQVNIGDILEVSVVLSTYPPKVLYLYGETVRIGAAPVKIGGFIIGIKYINMNKEVSDEIIKFDFKKHREKLITGKGTPIVRAKNLFT